MNGAGGAVRGGRLPALGHLPCLRLTAGSAAALKCLLWAKSCAWCCGAGAGDQEIEGTPLTSEYFQSNGVLAGYFRHVF